MTLGVGAAVRWWTMLCIGAVLASAQDIPGSTAKSDVASLREAAIKNPENSGLKLRLAKALLDATATAKRAEPARTADAEVEVLFGEIRKARPDAAVPLRAAVREAYYRRKFDEAAVAAKKLLAAEPEDIEIATLYVKSLIRMDKDEDAASFFLDWVKSGLSPSSGTVQGLLSTIAPRPKVRAALDKGFADLATTAPRHPLLGLTHAGFLAETGRTDDAWKVFHKAEADGLCDLALGSRHAFAMNLASRAPEPAEPTAVAGSDLEELKKAVAAFPNHAGLRLRLARRLESPRPKMDEAALKVAAAAALVEYQRVCEINPSAWTAHFRAGELLMELGQAKESLPYFAKAIELFPAYAPWHLAEAEAKAAVGDATGSAASFAAYAERFESDLFVRRLFDRVEKRGKIDWSPYVKAMQASAQKLPDSPYVQSNLAYVLFKSGDVPAAKKAAVRAEQLGLVGRSGVHAHAVLREVHGLPLSAESAPTTTPPDTGK